MRQYTHSEIFTVDKYTDKEPTTIHFLCADWYAAVNITSVDAIILYDEEELVRKEEERIERRVEFIHRHLVVKLPRRLHGQ